MSKIKATYKSKDTEEFLDKILYRPIGYMLAVIARRLKITPNQVTILSIIVGVAGGHMFYYNDLTLNIYGMLLLMFAQALDGADGQLARMTNSQSLLGRILDGFSDNLKFLSIYLHLIARYVEGGGTPWILAIAAVAGLSHSFQSAMADYYRNIYVLFVLDKSKSEIDNSVDLHEQYKKLTWGKNFIRKFLMRIYINYTLQQEFLAEKVNKLFELTKKEFGDDLPHWFRDKYRELHKLLIKWYNILTTNTRMIILFIAIFAGYPNVYWIFELTILNFLLIYVLVKHNNYSNLLTEMIYDHKGNA